MDQRKIKCECKKDFDTEEFSKHFVSCKDFKNIFNEFDSRMAYILKKYAEPKERLLIIHFLLKQYINVIERKIGKYLSASEPPKPKPPSDSIIFCQNCKMNPDILYLPCLHQICHDCFINSAEKGFYDMKCNICQQKIDEETKRAILGNEKYLKIEKKYLEPLVQGLTKCPYENCGKQYVFVEGKVDYNIVDDQNKKISKLAAEDYAKHRCKCDFCKRDFCISCSEKPYHLGRMCIEFSCGRTKRCRFCDNGVSINNKGPDDDVCNEKECSERYLISCKKKLKCGHKCFGVNGEMMCPPCIDKECKEYNGQFDQNKDIYCIICYTEGLGSSPIAVLSCGHYFHYVCIKKN